MGRLITVLLLLLTVSAQAEIAVPPPEWVVDQAGVLNPGDKARVEQALQALSSSPHPATMAILIVDRIPDGDIETYALTVGRQWGLGRAGVNDGLLLVHAVQDRRYRFEVGPGLQGTLNDAAIGDIGRQYLVPELKANHPREAYLAAIEAISSRLGNTPEGSAPVEETEPVAAAPDSADITRIAIMIVFAVILGIALQRRALLGGAGSAVLTGGTVAYLGVPVGAELLQLMLVGGGLTVVVALVSRNFGQIMLALASNSSTSQSDTSSDNSSFSFSSSDSSSSPSGGGDFDGGGASGDY